VDTRVEADTSAGAALGWRGADRASLDDHELVRRARTGDADAFEELVRRHAGPIYRLLVRLLGDPTAAEDVTQETFIGAWRSLPRFRGEAKFSTWLFRIAVNKGNTFLSREARRRLVPLHEAAGHVPDLGAEPFQLVAGRQMHAELERWIAELPASYRAAVVLRDIEGLANEEAAAALGIGVRNFKSRLHRGRMTLRRRLEDVAAKSDAPVRLESGQAGIPAPVA
jgi:RNA polymerase sigma-70 factor (ECF subfamily)